MHTSTRARTASRMRTQWSRSLLLLLLISQFYFAFYSSIHQFMMRVSLIYSLMYIHRFPCVHFLIIFLTVNSSIHLYVNVKSLIEQENTHLLTILAFSCRSVLGEVIMRSMWISTTGRRRHPDSLNLTNKTIIINSENLFLFLL